MVNHDSLKVSPPDSVLGGALLQSSERQGSQRAWARDHVSSKQPATDGRGPEQHAGSGHDPGGAVWGAGEHGAGPRSWVSALAE